jgi:hypothetical protein
VPTKTNDFIKELEDNPKKFETIRLEFEFKNKSFKGYAVPMMESCHNGFCNELDITLNDKHLDVIRCTNNGWRMTGIKPQGLVNVIGDEILLGYDK